MIQFVLQNFMFVGLLFNIPEQDERRIGNSEFSAPSGRRNSEVVVIVVVVVVVAVAVAVVAGVAVLLL